jgi:hypothetical protein
MFPGSPGGTTSLRVRLTLSFLLVAMLGIPGVPSFAETPATPAGGIQNAPPTPAATAPATAPARERRPQPLDEVSAIFEQKGVLTPKYSVTFEPSVQYTHSSSSRVTLIGYTIVPAVTIGLIDVQDVNEDMFIGALAFRFGITNRLELEFKIPYVYRNNSGSSAPLNTPTPLLMFSTTGYGFGDEEATLRWQLNQPAGPGGIYIASLRGKLRNGKDPFEVPYRPGASTEAGAGLPSELPVGSGFYTVQPGITMIFPADPAVLFGTLNYQWNVKRDIGGVGTLDPGDAIEANFGMGIGLNENLSFSLGYDHTVLMTSTLDEHRLGNSKTTQVGTLLFGASYRYSNRTNINVSLGIGATSTSPDVQFTVKVPMNFF